MNEDLKVRLHQELKARMKQYADLIDNKELQASDPELFVSTEDATMDEIRKLSAKLKEVFAKTSEEQVAEKLPPRNPIYGQFIVKKTKANLPSPCSLKKMGNGNMFAVVNNAPIIVDGASVSRDTNITIASTPLNVNFILYMCRSPKEPNDPTIYAGEVRCQSSIANLAPDSSPMQLAHTFINETNKKQVVQAGAILGYIFVNSMSAMIEVAPELLLEASSDLGKVKKEADSVDFLCLNCRNEVNVPAKLADSMRQMLIIAPTVPHTFACPMCGVVNDLNSVMTRSDGHLIPLIDFLRKGGVSAV